MSAETIVKSFIDRVLRLKEEQDALASDIREVYAEAKGNGFDKTAMGEVVAYLRKIEKKGKDAVDERSAMFDLYLDAYERPSHTHAREASQSYAEAKGVEPRGFLATLTAEQKAAALAYRDDDTHGAELTQEQPVEPATAAPIPETTKGESDAKSADVSDEYRDLTCRRQEEPNEQDRSEHQQVRSGRNIAGVAAPRIGTSTAAPAESAAISAPIPHSPAQASQALQADKTSEAALSSTASLAPPAGTKHADTNFGSDPLNNAPSADADQAGAIVGHPVSAVAPAAPSAMNAKTKGDVIRLLRPFCQHADDLGKCGGQSSRHCNDCEKLKRAAAIREDA